MSSIVFEKSVVDETVNLLSTIDGDLTNLSSDFRDICNSIVNARGFQQYVGGFSYNDVDQCVEDSRDTVNKITGNIVYKECSILEYSGDTAAIESILASLSPAVKSLMDSQGLSSNSSGEATGNLGDIFLATGATLGVSVVEGFGQFIEAGVDLVTMAGAGVASIFTGAYDLITGGGATSKLWEGTKAFVSNKHCTSIFDTLYNDTSVGNYLKNNAYGFDTVRSIGNGIGYATGVVALSGLTLGAGAGALGLTAGSLGVARGSEKAWSEGASVGKGLAYGLASGAWEGVQWGLGAKINQLSTGGQVAKGIFKGAQGGVGKRILLDSAVATAEGFVQPALSMIYKDYGGDNLFNSYTKAFEENGGWKSVAVQAVIGGTMSTASEIFMGRMALNKQKGDSANVSVDDTPVVYKEYSNEEFPIETRKSVSEWKASLNEDQIKVIENYIGEDEACSYRTINGLARKTLIDYDTKEVVLKGPKTERRIPLDKWMTDHNESITSFLERTRNDIETLNDAIRKSDIITEPTILHRAAADKLDLFKSLGLSGEPTLEKLQTLIGKEYFEEGFMSCSPGKVPFKKKINFELELDPGTHAASLYPWNANENEVLLELKQRFLIKDVVQNGDNFTIKMRTIPFK